MAFDPTPADDAAEELTELLLDHLLPALHAYHLELAHRFSLAPAELVCLDAVRQNAAATIPMLGRSTGVTRSAVVKMVRRLVAAGHVERTAVKGRREVTVRLCPNPERDLLHDEERAALRRHLTEALITNGVVTDDRLRAAATWTALAARTVGERAVTLRRGRDEAAHRAQRREARRRAGLTESYVP